MEKKRQKKERRAAEREAAERAQLIADILQLKAEHAELDKKLPGLGVEAMSR